MKQSLTSAYAQTSDLADDDADPLLSCIDCNEEFRFSTSIDEDRCDRWATAYAHYLGRGAA